MGGHKEPGAVGQAGAHVMKPPSQPPQLARDVAPPQLRRVTHFHLVDRRQQMIHRTGNEQVDGQLDHDDDRQYGGANIEPGRVSATRHLGGESGSVLPCCEYPASLSLIHISEPTRPKR